MCFFFLERERERESTVVSRVLCRFGQFVVATLPIFPGSSEKNLTLLEAAHSSSVIPCEHGEGGEEKGERESDSASNIILRNRCLQLLHSLLFTPRNAVSLGYVELFPID
jgi:hypothetical protein